MGNNVYICGWSHSSEGFSLWTKTGPRMTAQAPTYVLAEERLIAAIQERDGATYLVLEFDPPLPRSEQECKYTRPELYLIGGDDRFETAAARRVPFETAEEREARFSSELDIFFERPLCRKCESATAPRSEQPLELTSVPSRFDGAFGHLEGRGSPRLQIVSEEFLDLLSLDERQRLVLHPTVNKGRSRRKFYELVGPAGPPFVAAMELPVNGWRCSACNYMTWGYWIDGMSIRSCVADSDLPQPLPSLFTVGTPPEIYLCVTGERWRELLGKKGVRGFVSEALGIVSDQELIRHPDLPSNE